MIGDFCVINNVASYMFRLLLVSVIREATLKCVAMVGRNMKQAALYIKGKAIPLQAWTGTEGSRRMRIPDFKIIDTCGW
jgi:hypothetical protein